MCIFNIHVNAYNIARNRERCEYPKYYETPLFYNGYLYDNENCLHCNEDRIDQNTVIRTQLEVYLYTLLYKYLYLILENTFIYLHT